VLGLFRALLAGLLPLTGPAIAIATVESTGEVLIKGADGVLRTPHTGGWTGARAVSIPRAGGIQFAWGTATLILESADANGADLELGHAPADHCALRGGHLEVRADSAITVELGRASVVVQGTATFLHAPDLESTIRVFEGRAVVSADDKTFTLAAQDGLRVSSSGEISRARLIPPPVIRPPDEVVEPPLTLTAVRMDERISAGAIRVEVSDHETFWQAAENFIVRPDEPVVITDLSDGTKFLRVSSVNRAGLAGPPGPVFRTTVLSGPPEVRAADWIQTGRIRGQFSPPIPRAEVVWHHVRTVSDDSGSFVIAPDLPYGLVIADIRPGASAMALLSDPDHFAWWLEAPPEQIERRLFVRTDILPFRNASSRAEVRLDGRRLPPGDTRIAVPPATARTFEFFLDDQPFGTLLVQQDVEGPKILNVGLETRGPAERFYVLADVVDLGIGLDLPALAIFESDAGERVEIPLHRVSKLRLEGRTETTAPPRGRSRIWWVRVEARDLLGNLSRFEQAIYYKRQKKYLSISLKDLVKIWKNKI